MDLPTIAITLYTKNDEIVKTYERQIVPWGLLKKAARLAEQADVDTESDDSQTTKKRWWSFLTKKRRQPSKEEGQFDEISKFVIELFENKFTLDELERGADIGEVMSVFYSVLHRANISVRSNPIFSQLSRKKRLRK